MISARSGDAPRQIIDDLASVLAGLRDLGLRADCLAWITGCEVVDADCLAGLVRLGAETGTAVLLSTTSAAHAVGLAAVAGTIVAAGPITDNLAAELAIAIGTFVVMLPVLPQEALPFATSQQTMVADPTASPRRDYAIQDILAHTAARRLHDPRRVAAWGPAISRHGALLRGAHHVGDIR